MDHRIERHILALGWVLPCQGKEVTHNPHTALGSLHNGLHGFDLDVVLPLLVEEVSLHHDDAERIIELMRHTRQHCAHSGELLVLEEHGLLLPQLGFSLLALSHFVLEVGRALRHPLFQDGVGLLERFLSRPRLLIQSSIVEGQGRTAGEFLGQDQVRRTVAPHPLAEHTGDRTQHPATGQEWNNDFRLKPQGLHQSPMGRIPGLGPQPGRGHRRIKPGLPRAQHLDQRVWGIWVQYRVLLA